MTLNDYIIIFNIFQYIYIIDYIYLYYIYICLYIPGPSRPEVLFRFHSKPEVPEGNPGFLVFSILPLRPGVQSVHQLPFGTESRQR